MSVRWLTPLHVRGRLWGLVTAVLCILADQASKAAILLTLGREPGPFAPRVEVLPILDLVLAYNRGVSFSLFASDLPWKPYALSAVALVIVAFLGAWLWKAVNRWQAVALGMVIGGALGNVIDRLRIGAVVDFLDVHALGWHFPAFNIADSCITLGVAILLIEQWWPRARPAPRSAQSST